MTEEMDRLIKTVVVDSKTGKVVSFGSLWQIAFCGPSVEESAQGQEQQEQQASTSPKAQAGPGEIKITPEGVYFDGKSIRLSEEEKKILVYLVKHREEVVSREVLAREVGVPDWKLRDHMRSVRRILRELSGHSRWIKGVHGGYWLIAEVKREISSGPAAL
jgi:DNA-binding winged helix-turn-helix (wHTH) protein